MRRRTEVEPVLLKMGLIPCTPLSLSMFHSERVYISDLRTLRGVKNILHKSDTRLDTESSIVFHRD